MAVSLDYYRTFYYVGKYGSFTQAARALSNNQPNVTRIMNNLEAELGCRLFVRSNRGVTLTPEGERLFTRVEAAFHQIRIGESEVAESRSLTHGSLSIAVSDIALHGFLLPVLQGYKAAHPGIRIRIYNHTTPQGVEAVARGIAELAVVSSPAAVTSSLEETVVQTFREILVAGKGYASLRGRTLSLRELSELPFITLSRDTSSFAFFKALFEKAQLSLEPSVEAATTDQILPLVAHDMGLGFLPESFASAWLREDAIFRVDLAEEIPLRKLCLIQDKSRPLSLPALALKEAILRHS